MELTKEQYETFICKYEQWLKLKKDCLICTHKFKFPPFTEKMEIIETVCPNCGFIHRFDPAVLVL